MVTAIDRYQYPFFGRVNVLFFLKFNIETHKFHNNN